MTAQQAKEEHRRGVLEAARARLSLGAWGAEPGTNMTTTAERYRAKPAAAASSAEPGTAEWLWSSMAACPPAKPGESFKSLYNVTDDPHEENDVAADHPDIVERMKNAVEAWHPVKGSAAAESS